MNIGKIQTNPHYKQTKLIILVIIGLLSYFSLYQIAHASYTKTFTISAYYSPLPDQSRYVTGSYEGDIRLNGSGVRSADGTALRAVCSGSGDKRYLVGWVFDQFATLAPDTTQATLTFPPMPTGSHRVRWFEGTTGNEMKTDRIDGPSFSVTSPPFLGHAAFYIEPRR